MCDFGVPGQFLSGTALSQIQLQVFNSSKDVKYPLTTDKMLQFDKKMRTRVHKTHGRQDSGTIGEF